MAGVLIVGCGNPIRCDDGLVWHVAEQLSRLSSGKDVEVIIQHQLTPELAFPVSQAESVLFIDAGRTGVPGEIVSSPLEHEAPSSAFSHDFTPAAILTLSEQLYARRPFARIISLCGECFDHGETLSRAVRESLPRLVALIRELAGAPPFARIGPVCEPRM